jgi:hypothetical protein
LNEPSIDISASASTKNCCFFVEKPRVSAERFRMGIASSWGSHLLGGRRQTFARPLESQDGRVVEGRQERHQRVEVVVFQQRLQSHTNQ